MADKDFLKELGFLAYVTRMKRLSDNLIHDGRRLYKELGMDIEPNWFVVFRLLDKNGEMTVTELADAFGFAHPSVVSMVNKMTKGGYIESRTCDDDSRRRLLKLTSKAKKRLPEFERVWAAGVAGFKQIVDEVQAIEFLEALERKVAEKGFKDRALEKLERDTSVAVVPFAEELGTEFARLNYAWISELYEIEEHDREQLDEPKDYIVDKGGEIFFAQVAGNTVGTVALIELGNGSFELAKMAVDKEYRGFGIGEKLMDACVEHGREKGKHSLILESNTRQVPAIRLYRKAGFKEIPLDPNTPYTRANIRMELVLSDE